MIIYFPLCVPSAPRSAFDDLWLHDRLRSHDFEYLRSLGPGRRQIARFIVRPVHQADLYDISADHYLPVHRFTFHPVNADAESGINSFIDFFDCVRIHYPGLDEPLEAVLVLFVAVIKHLAGRPQLVHLPQVASLHVLVPGSFDELAGDYFAAAVRLVRGGISFHDAGAVIRLVFQVGPVVWHVPIPRPSRYRAREADSAMFFVISIPDKNVSLLLPKDFVKSC